MSLSVISFTENGLALSGKVRETFTAEEVNLFTKCSFARESAEAVYVEESTGQWAGKQMEEGNALLFIGACGIAVRAVAPWIKDKLHDSPVLVMDEMGHFVIPVLSGHMGGANELAERISKVMGAVPVITTATDLNRKFAVDLFAKRNHLAIADREGIAKISSKILAGEKVTVSVEYGHLRSSADVPEELCLREYPPQSPVDILIDAEGQGECLIHLFPKEYVIGMGCRKGKEPEEIAEFIRRCLKKNGIAAEQVYALASIDIKKEEQGFLSWSRKEKVPFYTYSAGELLRVEGEFHGSEFVKKQTGVDNVCERAALRVCAGRGKLLQEKQAEHGMTLAIAKREWSVSFDGE